MKKTIVRTEGLKKYYPVGGTVVKALDGVDLEIREREFVSVIGKSGSGKSTLLHMLGGLDVPTEGRVIVDGEDLSTMNDEQLAVFRRRKAGFIFQQYNLIPDLNVYDNITFPQELDGAVIDRDMIDDLLKVLDIEEKKAMLPSMLSGGQQQRVAIARALAMKPAIILADEPTGNLDSTTSRQVLYSMLEMAKSYGITFVMVTHEKELAYCGDRIVTIKDGRVLDNVLLGEDEKAENRRRLFGDVTSGDIAEPETTVAEGKKPAARQAKAVAAAVAEKVNQESM